MTSATDENPVRPDDSQTCVNALQDSLRSRGVHIPRPNATCAAAFNLSAAHHNAVMPTSAVRALESNCTDSSYRGCTKCLRALDKLKGKKEGYSDKRSGLYGRDCELIGLTWLLAKNKTVYIPTVSAVIRALMYSPPQSQCSPDQQNMPLAVDSVQLSHSSFATLRSVRISSLLVGLYSTGILMLLLFLFRF